MANPMDSVLSHCTSKERQPAAVPELPNNQPHQSPKQSHAEDLTEHIEATSGVDHRWRTGSFNILQHISGKDHERYLRRSWRHCQHWRQSNHQSPLCWWHRWLSRRGRTGKISWASQQSLHSLQHGDQWQENQANDKQHQWHQHRNQNKWKEAWDCHKLQVPGLSYNWCGFQAKILSRIAETTAALTRLNPVWNDREYFSQFQDALMHSLVRSVHSQHRRNQERFWKKCRWIDRKGEIPGSKRSMYGYILTYSRF